METEWTHNRSFKVNTKHTHQLSNLIINCHTVHTLDIYVQTVKNESGKTGMPAVCVVKLKVCLYFIYRHVSDNI